MSTSLLSNLEQASVPQAGETPIATAFVELWQEWLRHNQTDRTNGAQNDASLLHTYLLIDGWDDHDAWCIAFARQWPQQTAMRQIIKDQFDPQPPERSLFLVPLPESLIRTLYTDSLQDTRDREHFTRLLEMTWRTALRRTGRQRLCALLRTPVSMQRLVPHLRALAVQRPVGESQPIWFRFHDPRVQQRLWPELSIAQQRIWLGPVQQWWQLGQAFQGWTREQVTDALASAGAALRSGMPDWCCFEAQDEHYVTPFEAGRFLRTDDLRLANTVPLANRIWRRFLSCGIAKEAQPDGSAMRAWLRDGIKMGLSDSQLEDYVWCSYQLGQDGNPVDWQQASWQRVKATVLQTLQQSTDSSFSKTLDQVLQHGGNIA